MDTVQLEPIPKKIINSKKKKSNSKKFNIASLKELDLSS